jgi:outer membrane murein-binding lipoprotein Lpp
VLSSCEKDTLITTLLAQVEALTARVAALETENAAFREPVAQP